MRTYGPVSGERAVLFDVASRKLRRRHEVHVLLEVRHGNCARMCSCVSVEAEARLHERVQTLNTKHLAGRLSGTSERTLILQTIQTEDPAQAP